MSAINPKRSQCLGCKKFCPSLATSKNVDMPRNQVIRVCNCEVRFTTLIFHSSCCLSLSRQEFWLFWATCCVSAPAPLCLLQGKWQWTAEAAGSSAMWRNARDKELALGVWALNESEAYSFCETRASYVWGTLTCEHHKVMAQHWKCCCISVTCKES